MPEPLNVSPELSIPIDELVYRASRSGGPGGQHVNTSSTRIELRWDLAGSPSLSPQQRARLFEKLGPRLDTAGLLRLVSSSTRSQLQNKEEVTERFRRVVARALAVPKLRKKTRPSRAAKERRIQAKKRRGDVKRSRRRVGSDD